MDNHVQTRFRFVSNLKQKAKQLHASPLTFNQETTHDSKIFKIQILLIVSKHFAKYNLENLVARKKNYLQ